MTYAQKLKPEKETLIQSIVPELESLKPGENLTVSESVYRNQIVYTLYEYFNIQGIKHKYKITKPEPGKFTIHRLATPNPKIMTSETRASCDASNRLDDFVKLHLSSSKEEFIKALKAQNFSTPERVEAFNTWTKLCGGTP